MMGGNWVIIILLITSRERERKGKGEEGRGPQSERRFEGAGYELWDVALA